MATFFRSTRPNPANAKDLLVPAEVTMAEEPDVVQLSKIRSKKPLAASQYYWKAAWAVRIVGIKSRLPRIDSHTSVSFPSHCDDTFLWSEMHGQL